LVTCNGDRMQHPLKGIIGIKITGVQSVKFKGNINIENLYDSSELGSTLCGAYDKANFGQQLPYSTGFSGNMIHAMDVTFSDIKFETKKVSIKNIISDTGLSYGLSTWYGSELTFSEDIDFSIFNIKAGAKYLDDSTEENDERYALPNHKAQGCGIRIHQNAAYPVTIEYGDDDTIFKQQCIRGLIGCEDDQKGNGKQFPFTHLGMVNNKECQDLREPDFLGENENNNDQYGVNEFVVKGQKEEEMISNVHYFGNVFILAIISALIIGVVAIYYCFCVKETELLTGRTPTRWNSKDITAYGSF